MRKRWIAAALIAANSALPAAAQQLSPADLAKPSNPGLLPPTETGKPLLLTPPPLTTRPGSENGCVPGLPCGTRLLGAVQKNGAVAVEFPALKW